MAKTKPRATINVPVTRAQKRAIRYAATAAGMATATWLRYLALRAAGDGGR